MSTTLHLCIAWQNAANFIPLKTLQGQDIWVLETPDMQKQHSIARSRRSGRAAECADTHPAL